MIYKINSQISSKMNQTCEVRMRKTFNVSASQLSCWIWNDVFLTGTVQSSSCTVPNTLTCRTRRLWSGPFSSTWIWRRLSGGIVQLIHPANRASTSICEEGWYEYLVSAIIGQHKLLAALLKRNQSNNVYFWPYLIINCQWFLLLLSVMLCSCLLKNSYYQNVSSRLPHS